MKEFKFNKVPKKKKREKIDNPEHFADVHNIPQDHVKVPDELSKSKRKDKSKFPHAWHIPSEKRKGPKV